MRICTRLLSVILLLAMVCSLFSFDTSAAGTQPSTYSDQYNSGTRDVVCTTLSGTGASDYYTGNYTFDTLSNQNKDTLLQSLRTLMTSTHDYISSYDDCHYKADRTDCQNGDKSVTLIYTSYKATMSQWNGWNREHVWPKSLGGNNTRGGGADLHHIRPSDASVNSSRGNKKYGNVNGGTAKYGNDPADGCLGGHYNSSYFEPLDNVKGDVARICLYVYVRWGSDWGATSITKVFQSVDVLLEWMELDPVDTWEMGRNEVIEDIQGNRNVFIDYPEYAWLLFGEEVPAGLTTPSGKGNTGGGNTSGGNTGGGNTSGGNTSGGNNTPCTHPTTELRGKQEATCTAKGYTGDTYCTVCKVLVSSGSDISAKGHTDSNRDNICDSCKTSLTCDHRMVDIRNAAPATCTTDGYSGDAYCLDCGKELTAGKTVPATGHTDANGDNRCDDCEAVVDPSKEETIPPTSEETVPPTSEETVPPTTESIITTVPATGPATAPTEAPPAMNTGSDSDGSSPAIWIAVAVVILLAVGIVVFIVVKKKKAAKG